MLFRADILRHGVSVLNYAFGASYERSLVELCVECTAAALGTTLATDRLFSIALDCPCQW